MQEIYLYFAVGAAGALCKDIVQDGKFQLPQIKDGFFYTGFLGGLVIGAVTGWLTDHSLITAFASGFAGSGITTALAAKINQPEPIPTAPQPINTPVEAPITPSSPILVPADIKTMIVQMAQKYGVKPELALMVAHCESGMNPMAININAGGSTDRGLYQINDKYHPEVTSAQAFDPVFSAEFFCKAASTGKLSWWSASQKCWGAYK